MEDQVVVEQAELQFEGKPVFEQKDFTLDTFQNGAIYDDELYTKLKGEQPVVEKVEQKVEEQVVEEKPVIDFDSLLKEKTGGKFEKWDDLNAKLEKPDLNFENESTKQFFDYVKEGKVEDLEQFLLTRKALRSAEGASDADVVKLVMQIQDPEIDRDDVEDDFNEKFKKPVEPIEDDFDSDSEYTKALSDFNKNTRKYERSLKKEAEAARVFIKTNLEELKLPDLPKAEIKPEVNIEEDVNKIKTEISSSVSESLKNINDVVISIDNKDVVFSHKYTFSEAEKQEAMKAAEDYFTFFDNRYAKDGKYDGNQLSRDILRLQNEDKIMQAAISDAIAKERLNITNNIANHKKEAIVESVDSDKTQERQNLVKFLMS